MTLVPTEQIAFATATANIESESVGGYETLADFIAAAASLMDEHFPGWAENIDLKHFDITSPRCCVLGYNGGFNRGLDEMFGSEFEFRDPLAAAWCASVPSDVDPMMQLPEVKNRSLKDDVWDIVTDQWRVEIERRLV